MKKPKEAVVREWIDLADEMLELHRERLERGDADQSRYTSMASQLASKARVKYLYGDPIEEVRATFKRSAELMEMSFIMAYDESSPHYLGNTDEVDWADVDEVCCLEMMAWALISYDFEYTAHVARWVRPSPDNAPMDIEVTNFVYALKHTLEGQWQEADDLVSATFALYPKHPPTKNDYRRNYYTLSWALAGILRQDDTMLNEGLRQQLDFYRSYAEGEAADTDEQYFCDNALALAILGKRMGRTILVEGDYFPRDLL